MFQALAFAGRFRADRHDAVGVRNGVGRPDGVPLQGIKRGGTGLSLAFRVTAPLKPPRRPMAAMTWEMIAWFGTAGSPPLLRLTTSAANWLMSWDCLRARLGMSQVSHLGARRQAFINSKDPTTR